MPRLFNLAELYPYVSLYISVLIHVRPSYSRASVTQPGGYIYVNHLVMFFVSLDYRCFGCSACWSRIYIRLFIDLYISAFVPPTVLQALRFLNLLDIYI